MKPNRFLTGLLTIFIAAFGAAWAVDDFISSDTHDLTNQNRVILRSSEATHNGNTVQIPHSIATIGAITGATDVSSSAYEASHVIKASAGTLVALVGYNSKASAQFVQVFDSATVPADTAVPLLTFTVAATSNFSVTVPITGLPCLNGIAVANSSTGPTKTIGSADCFFTAVIK